MPVVNSNGIDRPAGRTRTRTRKSSLMATRCPTCADSALILHRSETTLSAIFGAGRAQSGCPLCASGPEKFRSPPKKAFCNSIRLRKRKSPHRLAIFEKPNPDGSLVTALRWRLRSPPNRSVRATPYGKLYVRPRLIPRPAFTVPIEGTVRLVTPDFMPRTCS